ncbi:BtpA/SgcQ family protein [Candidatus Roizmanbacteria bacterium]|nr:BtpA/SgcQ family protein [Candidatus Roizmanbacteria bacterium]
MKKNKFLSLFSVSNPVIGVVHFLPLLGFTNHSSMDKVYGAAKIDTERFIKGGISGIFFENNYDLPHRIYVGPETIASMTYLISRLTETIKIPFGVSVLWNDYKSAFAIAKATDASFIRIPVFVDDVKTSFGNIHKVAKQALGYQKKINAEAIAICSDIQVKHSVMLNKTKSITRSAIQAIKAGADALIITGQWTGKAPEINKLKQVRKKVGGFPILIGSGINQKNIQSLKPLCNGVIVSTSLKAGYDQSADINRNIKSYKQRISLKKVKTLMKSYVGR